MSKPYKRKCDKYNGSSYGSAMLISIHCPNIQKILEWLEARLKPSESIAIYPWTDDWFYIEVTDSEIKASIVNARIAFTVNVRRDRIMYCNDFEDNTVGGGNCFVRANKWKTYLKKEWAEEWDAGRWHIYKDPYRREGTTVKKTYKENPNKMLDNTINR